jgi:hypothetical protein
VYAPIEEDSADSKPSKSAPPPELKDESPSPELDED